MSGPVDDYRHGGQSGVGQLSGLSQPQPGSIEEFPPLGRMGDMGHDRRANMIQNAAGGGFSNAPGFSGILARMPVHVSMLTSQAGLSNTRTTVDALRQNQEKPVRVEYKGLVGTNV